MRTPRGTGAIAILLLVIGLLLASIAFGAQTPQGNLLGAIRVVFTAGSVSLAVRADRYKSPERAKSGALISGTVMGIALIANLFVATGSDGVDTAVTGALGALAGVTAAILTYRLLQLHDQR